MWACSGAGRDWREFRYRQAIYRGDGSLVWVANSVSTIPNEDGKISQVAAIPVDITERKRFRTSGQCPITGGVPGCSEDVAAAICSLLPKKRVTSGDHPSGSMDAKACSDEPVWHAAVNIDASGNVSIFKASDWNFRCQTQFKKIA
jgi:hypothetical protein